MVIPNIINLALPNLDYLYLRRNPWQAAEYTPPAEGGYTPSEDTVRLTNAINRGLERPEHPEDVVALILRGISARYACFEAPAASPDTQRLIREKAYAQAIKYITITAENAVTVTFK